MKRTFLTIASAILVTLLLTAFLGFDNGSKVKAPLETMASKLPATAQWNVDAGHSQVGFRVRHLGIAFVRGAFNEYEVAMQLDPEDLSSLQVETTIALAGIDTGNERRDNHLKSDDFFNAEQFPTITFVSKEVRNIDGGEFELVGDLTIRDVTKEVVLEAEFLGLGEQRGRRKVGFEAELTINRFDYNLKWGSLTEAGGLVVGEDVRINLELEMAEAETEATSS